MNDTATEAKAWTVASTHEPIVCCRIIYTRLSRSIISHPCHSEHWKIGLIGINYSNTWMCYNLLSSCKHRYVLFSWCACCFVHNYHTVSNIVAIQYTLISGRENYSCQSTFENFLAIPLIYFFSLFYFDIFSNLYKSCRCSSDKFSFWSVWD